MRGSRRRRGRVRCAGETREPRSRSSRFKTFFDKRETGPFFEGKPRLAPTSPRAEVYRRDMPKLKFTQKKGKRKGKAGDDSAAPEKRAKRAPAGEDAAGSKGNAPRLGSEPQRFFPEKEFKGARLGYYFAMGKYGLGYYLDAPEPEPTPEPPDVFDKVLGNQELLERIMLFLPTPGDLGRIASVNKLFKAASTSITLWDARYKHYPTLTLENTKLDKLKLYHRTGKFMKALLFLVRIHFPIPNVE